MSKQLGDQAETAVADFLQVQGFKILERNWRTRWCEIDIIAQKNGMIYFVEVKYRANDFQGEGFDYITKQKLKQMRFAAEFWLAERKREENACLSAASVDKELKTRFIDDLGWV